MADKLTKNMQRLADAIRSHPGQVKAALCGFDLWIEALSSPHMKLREMIPGGTFATGNEREEIMKIGVPVLGNRIVIAFDASLPPSEFLLRA